jgi:hypothetical protein
MSLREAYQMWRDLVDAGFGEIRLGLRMIGESRKR